MSKLTPAKRLKELRKNGWLDFVEFMEKRQIRPKDLRGRLAEVQKYLDFKTASFMGEDMLEDLYNPSVGSTQIIGLAEQCGVDLKKSKPKNNKLTKYFNRNVK